MLAILGCSVVLERVGQRLPLQELLLYLLAVDKGCWVHAKMSASEASSRSPCRESIGVSEPMMSMEQSEEQMCSRPPSRLTMKHRSPKCTSAPGTQSPVMMAIRHLVEKTNETRKSPLLGAPTVGVF